MRIKVGVARRKTNTGLEKGCEYISGSQPGNVAMLPLPLLCFCRFSFAVISALIDDLITVDGRAAVRIVPTSVYGLSMSPRGWEKPQRKRPREIVKTGRKIDLEAIYWRWTGEK